MTRARVLKELKLKIKERCKELEKTESKLTHLLWEDYFKKLKEKQLIYELEGI